MSGHTYQESIRLLEALYRTPLLAARSVGLRRTYKLLDLLDNPHRGLRTIHVAGTAGKGSTTTMIGSILSSAGFRTGLFRSPHLVRYPERIAVDEVEIGESEWRQVFDRVWALVERLSRNDVPEYNLGRPSLFEVLFAMCCVYFRQAGVDWAVFETGMGGRFDPTNALAPDVAVITNVSLEHTRVLGSTVSAIAGEKAAIIKPGADAMTAASAPEALAVIEVRAARVGAPLRVIGRDVQVEHRDATLSGQAVTIQEEGRTFEVNLPLAGGFQAVNAATAYAAIQALRKRGLLIADQAILAGLGAVQIPGRLQQISSDPLILLDGAHNPAGAHELAGSLAEALPGRRLHLLVAVMADKDIDQMAAQLGPIAASVVATRVPGTDRSADPDAIAEAFSRSGTDASVAMDRERALECALERAGAGDAVVVTGSMYLVGWLQKVAVPGRA
jgi:dihydrofolate synthase/folylpolyglutamate synthase